MKEWLRRLTGSVKKKIKRLFVKANNKTLPGFQGVSIYSVGRLFFEGVSKGYIADRAAAVAFNFFTALFPTLLMVFTFIPYVPIENFQESLLYYAQQIIPPEIWNLLNDTIIYIITHKSGNLLSISFVLSLYFGTNGINSLFHAFDQTYHTFTTASNWFKQRWHALLILMSVLGVIIVYIAILGFGNGFINRFQISSPHVSKFIIYLFQAVRILLSILSLIFAIAMIYYLAMPKKRVFKLFSPGTIISATLILVTTLGFSYFISNFVRYNILYGSLGTILILTLFLYLNAMFILIGFEMNISISSAKNTEKDKEIIKRM